MTAEPLMHVNGWTPLCMEPDELAAWKEMRARSTSYKDRTARPCTDCPLGFAAEMRAVSRCNGQPGAVEEDEEMGTFDYAERSEQRAATLPPPKATLPTFRRVSLDVAAPPCESCAHEPICSLRAALEGLADVETTAPALPAGLSLTLTAVVACGHFLRDRAKPAPVRALTSEQRGQANRPKRELSPEARERMAESGRRTAANAREALAAKRAAAREGVATA
jgi:hypothetical protein